MTTANARRLGFLIGTQRPRATEEQSLLDQARDGLPHLLTMDRIWIMDRNFPGAARRGYPAAGSFGTN